MPDSSDARAARQQLPGDPEASYNPNRPAGSAACPQGGDVPDMWTILVPRGGPDTRETVELAGKGGSQVVPPPAGAYSMRRIIGRGGIGEVWEAVQCSLGRVVAVKRLRSDLQRDGVPDSVFRRELEGAFRQEALTAAQLDHPNIVPVHDLGVDEKGRPLLAMKLVQGRSWDRVIREDMDMAVPDFLAKHLPILVSTAHAVAFAHSRGIIHRDIKPSQVMVGDFGEVLLMDWGLAVIYDAAALSEVSQRIPGVNMTTVDTASNPAGTTSYMAPEQTELTAAHVGPWTDVFLLGGTLYYLLTGSPPYRAPTSEEAMARAAVVDFEPPEVRAPAREVPPELSAIVTRAMAEHPRDRYPSVDAFVRALRDHLAGAGKRRESASITSDVAARLPSATGDYKAYGELIAALGNARALWPQNPELSPLRNRLLGDYARSALAHRDLVLARLQGERLDAGPHREALLREIAAREDEQKLADERVAVVNREVREQRDRAEELLNFLLLDLCEGLRRIGRLNLLEKVARRALGYFESLAPDQLTEEDLFKRSIAIRNLGEVLQDQGRLAEALNAYASAQAINQRYQEAGTPAWLGEAARTNLRVGDIHRMQGREVDALQCHRAALNTCERLAAIDAGNAAWRRLEADCCQEIGEDLRVHGDVPGALQMHHRALSIDESLARELPADAELQHHLATSLKRLGSVLHIQGHWHEARRSFLDAVAIVERLVEAEPANTTWQSDLGKRLNDLGAVMTHQGDLDDALETFLKARVIFERLRGLDPTNGIWEHGLARSLSRAGDIHRRQHHHQQAIECHRRALEHFARFIKADPTNLDLQNGRSWQHASLGLVYEDLGEADLARREWEEARRVIEEVIRTSRHERHLDTAACVYLYLGQVEDARPIVEELFRRGLCHHDLEEACRKCGLELAAPPREPA